MEFKEIDPLQQNTSLRGAGAKGARHAEDPALDMCQEALERRPKAVIVITGETGEKPLTLIEEKGTPSCSRR
jgi:hypothetical protein